MIQVIFNFNAIMIIGELTMYTCKNNKLEREVFQT